MQGCNQRIRLVQTMPPIQVSAAIIIKQNHSILTTQRGYGLYKGMWEFPGGKIEPGETPQQALLREIREELDVEITISRLIEIVEYDYPDFHLQMYCFLCCIKEGNLVLKEHMEAKWLSAENLDNVAWLPADLKVLGKIKEIIGEETIEDETIRGNKQENGEETDKRIRRNQAKDEEKD